MNRFSAYISLSAMLFSFISAFAQPGGCTPTVSPTCPTATVLVPGAACVTGTTCSGGAQAGSSCLYAGSECSWYEFTATATDMFVNIDVTATNGCHISSNVYEATGPCAGTEISCESGAPLSDLHSLSGLNIGGTYYVQVCYSPGGPCGNGGSADYCISVGEPDPPCDVCATPCGTATGYPTNPAVQTVVDDCQTSPFVPELQPNSTHTFCYNFVATATSVDFNVIITSNCGGGNVTNFSWELYNISCGAPVQTGNLSSLTFSPLTVGNAYVFCYTFTVPSTCTHSQHCPYFVGATVPLPVSFTKFTAVKEDDGVQLNWSTATELNCDYYEIERSLNGSEFNSIGTVNGNGTISEESQYRFFDYDHTEGVAYYRIRQVDINGDFVYTGVLSVDFGTVVDNMIVKPNPVNEDAVVSFSSAIDGSADIVIEDIYGNTLMNEVVHANRGENEFNVSTHDLVAGVYFIKVMIDGQVQSTRFLKQ